MLENELKGGIKTVRSLVMASNCGRGENLKLISFENGVSLDISDDLPVVVDALNEPLDIQVTKHLPGN